MTNYIKLLGLFLVAGTTLAEGAFLPVCERTEQVKKELERLTQKTCGDILEVDLLAFKRVAVQGRGIQAFKPDDFTGLKNLEILNIRSNPYTELPEGLFNDLGNLRTLVIISNPLRHFPDDFLEKTPLMEHLHVFRTHVRSLSESVFQRLQGLRNIKEIDFDDSLQEAEKARLRQIFPESAGILNFN